VARDDPATHACLCCGDYDADREPAYPCGDFREIEMWSDDDSEEDDDNFVQRLPFVDGLSRCMSRATPRHVPEDPSPIGPPTILYPYVDANAASKGQDAEEVTTEGIDVDDSRIPGARCCSTSATNKVQYLNVNNYGKLAWCKRRHRACDTYAQACPPDISREIDELMEGIDDDYAFATDEDTCRTTQCADHVVIVSPGVHNVRERALSCSVVSELRYDIVDDEDNLATKDEAFGIVNDDNNSLAVRPIMDEEEHRRRS
jgi:hypothetical protein